MIMKSESLTALTREGDFVIEGTLPKAALKTEPREL